MVQRMDRNWKGLAIAAQVEIRAVWMHALRSIRLRTAACMFPHLVASAANRLVTRYVRQPLSHIYGRWGRQLTVAFRQVSSLKRGDRVSHLSSPWSKLIFLNLNAVSLPLSLRVCSLLQTHGSDAAPSLSLKDRQMVRLLISMSTKWHT